MSHIQSLFYTFLWSFCPQLVQKGYVYASVPPLYKITTNKGYQYLKDDNALQEYKKQNPNKKITVNRLKGLGELDAHELEETMLDPKNRIIKQITVNDLSKTNLLFNDLMGTSVEPRKRFIQENRHKVEVKF